MRVLFCALLGLALSAAPASAALSQAPTLLDGPSPDIVGVDGVAMSKDGSGGLVYRKRVDGHIHVFAAQLAGGVWLPPQQVDVGNAYDAYSPAIGAGDGGELVVTYVGQFGGGTQDRMYGAVLGPGATSFQPPVALDLDVRDGQDTAPSLSMNAGGTAYLAYRVVYSRSDPDLPPGTVDADIRVARFGGSYWSLLGAPVDRNPAQPMRTPTATNGPQIATDGAGNATVAWSEPDDDLIDRIYARRLFGQTMGDVLQASPGTDPADASKPLRAGPDDFALDISPFGAVAIAYRQLPASGASFTQPRAMVNMLGPTTGEQAGTFNGARAVDGGGADGPGDLGLVSVGVDDESGFTEGFGEGPASIAATGDPKTLDPLARLDDGSSDATPDLQLDRGAAGELPAAWVLDEGGAGGVELYLKHADGSVETSPLSTDAGGPVGALHLSGSGLGDAAVAFEQGAGGAEAVAAATIDAPPEPFGVAVPLGWEKAASVAVTWDPAPAAIGGVSYSVGVDGQLAGPPLTGTATTLNAAALGDGKHPVQISATDPAGQVTQSRVAMLEVDRTAPTASVRPVRGQVLVKVRDAASGVAAGKVSWGDGKRGRLKAKGTHRYARAGRYRLTLTLKDKLGNTRTLRKTVRVR